MPTSVIEHLRRTVLLCDRAGLGDGEMLGRFIERHDEAALTALVKRHGPMVWGVCRRILGHHDAEDAFQATFLVLVRKAASIAQRELVGNWLYGVAHQTALQARRAAARRGAREVQVTEMPDAEAAQQDRWPDLQSLLDEELSRLPGHYRAVIVLCDLEGKTRKDVAAQLGCPEGTVASRLVRARTMLAGRLTQRGVALSGGTLAAALAQNVASAAMTASLAVSTIKAANLFAAGQAAIPLKVAALAEGVLKTMLLTKLKSVMAILVMAALVGVIGFGIARAQPKGDAVAQEKDATPKAPKAEAAVVKEKARKKGTTAWGKEVDGLQAGLALVPADAHAFRQGETVKCAVKLRNVGKAEVVLTCGVLREHAPQVTTDAGGRVSVYMPLPFDGWAAPIKLALKPGETVTLYNPEVAVESEARARLQGLMRVDTPTICVETGKYRIAFGGMIQSHPKLTTGTLGFEVKPAKDESFTAWGKEVGGLQAGLTIGEKRAYSHGETATLVVRVRNVGKEAVKFRYIKQYLDENPPTVTGADGKAIPQGKTDVSGLIHAPVEVSLGPGKEVVLESRFHGASGLRYQLRPAKGGGKAATRDHPLHVGTGKVSLQYERVFGSSSAGHLEPDPALSKLATGKLVLEIKDEAPGREAPPGSTAAYPTADVVIQYRDTSGRVVRDLSEFRVADDETVAELASHFPGILGGRGGGPRTSAGKSATLTIKFNHRSGEASRMRVAHVAPDFSTWWWRDNTPHTGDRRVEGKDRLQRLMERLAAKNKVDLK